MIGDCNHWRDTQKPARFFMFDPRIVVFVGLFLLHIKLWTFVVLVMVAIINIVLEYRGIRITHMHRILKTYLTGPTIPARGVANLRYASEYYMDVNVDSKKPEWKSEQKTRSPVSHSE